MSSQLALQCVRRPNIKEDLSACLSITGNIPSNSGVCTIVLDGRIDDKSVMLTVDEVCRDLSLLNYWI